MEVTLKPDLQTRSCNNIIVGNYRSQKFLDLLGPTQYASVTRLSPAFRVRVWLRETSAHQSAAAQQQIMLFGSPEDKVTYTIATMYRLLSLKLHNPGHESPTYLHSTFT